MEQIREEAEEKHDFANTNSDEVAEFKQQTEKKKLLFEKELKAPQWVEISNYACHTHDKRKPC